MSHFSATELARMRSTQTASMQDVGYIQDYEQNFVVGEEVGRWVERDHTTVLGLHMKAAQEVHDEKMEFSGCKEESDYLMILSSKSGTGLELLRDMGRLLSR